MVTPKLTPLQQQEALRLARQAGKPAREFTDAEKALRKDRVAKAKDALSRSVGLKGDQVPAARAALKTFLQRLNEPNQPSDEAFEGLLEAPFKVFKKRTNDRGF
jgi:hypothetical protein